MGLVYKQLYKQMIKDKIFLMLLSVLAMLTSTCFFFGMFSIDGNMEVLNTEVFNTLDSLTENQQLYKNALSSNTFLTYNFFASLIGLSALVFVMFFYRFFRANKRQMGCIKALGFKDHLLQLLFVVFTAALSFSASLVGLLGGYFLSDILINANSQTYLVTGLTKKIGVFSLMIGLGVPTAIFCTVAFLCYGFVRNREVGFLLAGNQAQSSFSITLKIADKISRIAPADKRLSLRIALRKPLSVLLLLIAVMSFSVCIILGQSLNISSAKVFDTQTIGHNYEYDIRYSEYQTAASPNNTLVYLDSPVTVTIENYELERMITGFYNTNELYELRNPNNEILLMPKMNAAYINPEFSEIFGVEIGDTLTVDIAGTPQEFMVEDIAVNASSKSFYVNGQQLAEALGISTGAYNGVLSTDEIQGDNITTRDGRIEELKRNAVSNQVSGVINQSVGVLVGTILIFLALYINFQDNTHDILILNMIGHHIRDIRKMLVNVYLPVLWAAFLVTLVPSVLLAKSIQKSLSISTNDYMPFGINVLVVLTAFFLISLIYWVVQITFYLGIKRVIAKREIMEIVYAE